MAIAVDQNYDKAQRKISTANLEQFAGVDCQLLVEKETHRPIIMDGTTVGGKFKCASTDEVKAVETVANNAISQATADSLYLKKEETAKLAERATSDSNGNVITNTYATKTELASGLESKQPTGNYALKSELQWDTISGKPKFATVATTGSYDDLENRPSIPATPWAYVTQIYRSGSNWYRTWSDGFIEQGGTVSRSRSSNPRSPITFLKGFTTTAYNAQATISSGGAQNEYTGAIKIGNKTNLGLEIITGFVEAANMDWTVSGY